MNAHCQVVLSAAMAAVSVRLTVYFFRMIARDVAVATVFCRPYSFPTVFVFCVIGVSMDVRVFVV